MAFKKIVSITDYLDNFSNTFSDKFIHDDVYNKKCIDSEHLINKFYGELSIIFLGTWARPSTQLEIDIYKRQLTYAVIDAGFTDEENMLRALKRARNYPITEKTNFPNISLVVSWMKNNPEDFQLPSLTDAYKEACDKSHPCINNKNFSHIVVEYAWSKTGSSKILKRTERNENEIKRLFSNHYNIGCLLFVEQGANALKNQNQHSALEHISKTGVHPEFKKCTTYEKAMDAINNILRK